MANKKDKLILDVHILYKLEPLKDSLEELEKALLQEEKEIDESPVEGPEDVYLQDFGSYFLFSKKPVKNDEPVRRLRAKEYFKITPEDRGMLHNSKGNPAIIEYPGDIYNRDYFFKFELGEFKAAEFMGESVKLPEPSIAYGMYLSHPKVDADTVCGLKTIGTLDHYKKINYMAKAAYGSCTFPAATGGYLYVPGGCSAPGDPDSDACCSNILGMGVWYGCGGKTPYATTVTYDYGVQRSRISLDIAAYDRNKIIYDYAEYHSKIYAYRRFRSRASRFTVDFQLSTSAKFGVFISGDYWWLEIYPEGHLNINTGEPQFTTLYLAESIDPKTKEVTSYKEHVLPEVFTSSFIGHVAFVRRLNVFNIYGGGKLRASVDVTGLAMATQARLYSFLGGINVTNFSSSNYTTAEDDTYMTVSDIQFISRPIYKGPSITAARLP